jgi:MFS transporter, DHA2 family, multidrug resistance protein
MPVVGFLLSRYDARWLMAIGLLDLSLSLFHMTHFSLGIDFHTVVMARVFQAAGLAFLFVPINTAAYAYLPREKNNAASGLMNLARNIGASVGISVVTTMLARRTQFHQNQLVGHITATNTTFQSMVQGLAQALQARGLDPSGALHQAYARVQALVIGQATMLAYIDCFWLLAVSIMLMVPFVFIMRRTKGASVAVH